VAAINTRVLDVLDDATVQALDLALSALTAHADRLNGEVARDVLADRRAGGSRRLHQLDQKA
jgi:hypothetical protein